MAFLRRVYMTQVRHSPHLPKAAGGPMPRRWRQKNAFQPFVAKMKDPAVFQAQLNISVTKHLQVGTAFSDQAVDVSGHEIPVMVGGVTRQPGDRIRCRACRLSASVSHWAY